MTRSTVCQDTYCGAEIEQPLTGRPKLYCDATCRKNAARFRAVNNWRTEHDAWCRREAERVQAHLARREAWDAAEPRPLIGWEIEAQAAGWQPGQGWAQWTWDSKAKLHGPRPAEYRTPAHDREPQRPGDCRMGPKTESYW